MLSVRLRVRRITVAVPSIEDLTFPLLEELADGRERSTRELWEQLALRFSLDAGDLAGRSADGRHLFGARVRAARERLRERGWLERLSGAHWRITPAGIEALLGADDSAFADTQVQEDVPPPHIGPGPFEMEVRAALGAAASKARDWIALSLLNGWNAEGIVSAQEVSRLTGRSVTEILELDDACERGGAHTPAIDRTLEFTRAHAWHDARELAFHLAQQGLVWTPMSPVGICEVARRLGREVMWRDLVRVIATSRGKNARDDTRMLPRPFESWFEVEVFLFLEDLGYSPVVPDRRATHGTDILIEDLETPLLIKCDGTAWRRGDRDLRADVTTELGDMRAYRVVRIIESEWHAHARRVQVALQTLIEELGPLPSAG